MREGSLSGPGRFRIRSHGGSSHLGSSRMLLQSRRMLRDEEVDASGEATRGKGQEEPVEPAAEPPTTEAMSVQAASSWEAPTANGEDGGRERQEQVREKGQKRKSERDRREGPEADEKEQKEMKGTEEKKRKREGPREGQCNCPCERPNELVNLIDDDADASLFEFQCPCTDCGPRKQIEGKIVRRCTIRMMLPEFLCEDCRDCALTEYATEYCGRFSTMLE